jgi:hypothetical protein
MQMTGASVCWISIDNAVIDYIRRPDAPVNHRSDVLALPGAFSGTNAVANRPVPAEIRA